MRAQVWSLDFIVALAVVLLCTSLFAVSVARSNPDTGTAELSTVAAKISEHLMSEGYPSSWTEGDVKRIGITDANWRINETKIDQLYTLPQAKLRHVLGTQKNTYVTLRNGSEIMTIAGNPFVGKEPDDARYVAVVKRYVIYKGDIMELRVVAWE